MVQPLLRVSDLKKAYGAIQAVGGVSFEVMPGEIFGVIGPNGSGKTTMFNSVLGQITPDQGRIELKSQDITGLSPMQLNQRGVGRTFQTLQVFGKMSVRDNLIVAAQEHQGSMWSRMFAPGDSGLGAKADALIDQFRIRHVADKKAGELSYGQQKLVDIAMAFMSDPDLVLLDEPCAGVNPSLVGGISTLLKELNRQSAAGGTARSESVSFSVPATLEDLMARNPGCDVQILLLAPPAADENPKLIKLLADRNKSAAGAKS